MTTTENSRADALANEKAEVPYVERFAESCMEGGGVYPSDEGDFVRYSDFVALARAASTALQPAAAPIEQSALRTVQDAIAAIETFEIVGENNDSREPNDEDRFILTEYIAHLFGGFHVDPEDREADEWCRLWPWQRASLASQPAPSPADERDKG